ncbi:MAG: hypothetical protein HUU20_02585 [Pirellulales bacterium]|nr:hypothetical protein [Pirellulales bacterium]
MARWPVLFELRDRGAVHAGKFSQVSEAQALGLASGFRLREQSLHLVEERHALVVAGDQIGKFLE